MSEMVHSLRVPEVGASVVKEGFMEEVRLELGLTE